MKVRDIIEAAGLTMTQLGEAELGKKKSLTQHVQVLTAGEIDNGLYADLARTTLTIEISDWREVIKDEPLSGKRRKNK